MAMRLQETLASPPRVSWQTLRDRLREEWKQGQHFSIIAPTGGGKSVMGVKGLLPLWKYTLTLDAKGEDPILAQSGRKVKNYPGVLRYKYNKFWISLPQDQSLSARFSSDVFKQVFQHKGWTLYVDELRLFSDRDYLPKYVPDLDAELERLWLYGRSRGITVVTGTQAPRWCPAAAFEQPTHFLIGRTQSRSNLKMMEKISADTDRIKDVVPHLERFEFLYVQAGSDEMAITKYPLTKGSGR